MLMIDAINSVLGGSARQQRQFLQLLRFLSNELQVAIVCAGVPEARFALLSDPQLRSRIFDVALDPWIAGPERPSTRAPRRSCSTTSSRRAISPS